LQWLLPKEAHEVDHEVDNEEDLVVVSREDPREVPREAANRVVSKEVLVAHGVCLLMEQSPPTAHPHPLRLAPLRPAPLSPAPRLPLLRVHLDYIKLYFTFGCSPFFKIMK